MLESLFARLDADGDESLGRREFAQLLQDNEVSGSRFFESQSGGYEWVRVRVCVQTKEWFESEFGVPVPKNIVRMYKKDFDCGIKSKPAISFHFKRFASNVDNDS